MKPQTHPSLSIHEARARKVWRFFLSEYFDKECAAKYSVSISVKKSNTHGGIEGRFTVKKKEFGYSGNESLSFKLDWGALNKLYTHAEDHPEALVASVAEAWAWQGDDKDHELIQIGRFLISSAKEFTESKEALGRAISFADRQLLMKNITVAKKTTFQRGAL